MSVSLDRLQCTMQGVLPYKQAKVESGGFSESPALTGAPRAYAGMVYDEASQQVILFGGDAGKGPVNETWVWDGQDWAELQPETRPPAQAGAYSALGYDPVLQGVVPVASLSNKETIPDRTEPSTWSEVWLWHSPGQP